MSKTEKIGILGGTFNPVHKGHLQMAKESQVKLGLDKVIFIPAAVPPLKPGEITAYAQRREWLAQAIAGQDTWEISDIEEQRQGKSYTYDTLLVLQEMYPQAELYFLTGADSLTTLVKWHKWQDILDLCYFVITTRPGYELVIQEEIRQVNAAAEKGILLLPIEALPISSTEIRAALQQGQNVEKYLPSEIIDEVKQAWQWM